MPPPNPPITIGPFSDVPAPGSLIASAWPQHITTFVTTTQTLSRLNASIVAVSGALIQGHDEDGTKVVDIGNLDIANALRCASIGVGDVLIVAIDEDGTPVLQLANLDVTQSLHAGSGVFTYDVSAHAFITTSDYRLKNVLGPITDALARLGLLEPHRVVWKDDPQQQEVDSFVAHEVAAVVPEAVIGEKDAVLENGEIDPQGLDATKLIPLLVAAVQELAARVVALEGA